jgi:hypothetical protein
MSQLIDEVTTSRPGTLTITEDEGRTDHRPDEGDHDRFSHYVEKGKLTEALVLGTPVIALCGKVWVPSRDPERFPVCPECKRLYDMGPQGRMREWRERAEREGQQGS